jgi:Halocarboxylic acid dehydrogenase DehI
MSTMPVISKFPQIDHDEVTGELAEIYEDIHATLRVPWVAFGIRVMSQFPAFVPAAWRALSPAISTAYAEAGADLVRQASIIDAPAPPDPRPALRKAGYGDAEFEQLRRTLDALNYGNPKYLILITAWNEAWHERAAGDPQNTLSTADARILPKGLPDGVDKFHLIDPDEAEPNVQELMRQVKDQSLHHGPASDYRVLAAWPDFLKVAIDEVLAPVALSAAYDQTSWRIRQIAREHVARFPTLGGVSRRSLGDVLSGPEQAGLTGLLFMYNRFIADITIAIIRLQQAFDGPEAAIENKFPVEL